MTKAEILFKVVLKHIIRTPVKLSRRDKRVVSNLYYSEYICNKLGNGQQLFHDDYYEYLGSYLPIIYINMLHYITPGAPEFTSGFLSVSCYSIFGFMCSNL